MGTSRRGFLRQAGGWGLGLTAAHLSAGLGWGQAETEPIGVVLGSDVHLVSDEPLSPVSFRAFVADVNENLPHARYALLLGDLVNAARPADLTLWAGLQGELRPTVYGVPGNHDFGARACGG